MLRGVALAGRAGSGKSPLAVHIVQEFTLLGYDARRFAFADALKEEVWQLFGMRKEDPMGRAMLISHGEARRSTDPTYWVRRLWDRMAPYLREGGIPVVDDVRREPEYARLSYEQFFRVRVMAPENLRRAALLNGGQDPDFAESEDPTERDHEVWLYDHRRVLSHTSRDFQDAAKLIAGHVLKHLG
jgi:hypothetical protein